MTEQSNNIGVLATRKNSECDIQDHPDNEINGEENEKKLKYPRSVFFIVTNEFCERFSYYGMRTVLVLYLRNKLNYNDDTSTVIYHVFTMFVYFFPLLGAMMADSLLGKFRTILYLSIVYALGQLLLSLSAAPVIGLPPRGFSLVGLLLIALGTGGIKPCVAAFGGDQFVLPQQERYLSMFFSLFYFAINSGSLISSFLTPMLRSNVACFNETSCYSLAFFVPAILMVLSIVIFLLGKSLYTVTKPTGNVVLNVSKCISHAISNKIRSKGSKHEHWLNYAEDKYDTKLINDIKAALQVLKLFIPLPVFWALFDQQGSRWTIQATRMNGEIGGFLIQPDQMQVVNPLLILAFIPLCETCIYPLFSKIHLLDTPLKKLTVGGLLASLSFVVSALVELQLEKTYPVLPSQGVAQLRIFNTMNCTINIEIDNESVRLNNLYLWENLNIECDGQCILKYKADFAKCNFEGYTSLRDNVTGNIEVNEATATSWVVTPFGIDYNYTDRIEKTKTGNPAIRGLIYIDPSLSKEKFVLKFMKKSEVVKEINIKSESFDKTSLEELSPDKYDIYLNKNLVQSDVHLKLGGVYTIVGNAISKTVNKVEVVEARILTVTAPNSMHILWLIPQYVIITMGEVMFSVTGLEFAFTQAPGSMKSLLQASWLLTVAFGNLIVVIVAEVSFFSRQTHEFFLFAGLMFVDIIIFAIMTKFYEYLETPNDASVIEDIPLEGKNGMVNPSFKEDEK